jgi:FixJ family two-component response regulator
MDLTGMIPDAAGEALVYLVDDDPSVRRGIARLLRSVGLAVKTFETAEEFLDSPVRDEPGCLVADVVLPGTSGLDLLPIVFITGQGNVGTSVRAMKDGAIDFLQKPVDHQQLLDSVQRAIEMSRQLQAERAEREEIAQRRARLTPRERQVMDLLVAGRINRRIAAELGNAEKTVKIHRRSVMDKMEVRSVAELVWLSAKIESPSPATAAGADWSSELATS